MKKVIIVLLGICMIMTAIAGTRTVRAADYSLEVSVLDGKMIIDADGDFGDKDWIGIYKQGESPDPNNGGVGSIVWWYINEFPDTVTIPDDVDSLTKNERFGEFIVDGKIVPGAYSVIAMENDGYNMIGELEPVTVNIESSEAENAVDYDASSYEGMEFQQIYWNGIKFNNYEGGESPLTALGTILTPDGVVDDAGGSGVSLGLAGWVGFDQEIVAFGSIVNGNITWNDAFDLGTNDTIKAEDKGGKYAKQFKVDIDISTIYGNYTAGVVAGLADGTTVKLNSTSNPENNTFISFIGPVPATAEFEIETGDDVDKVPGALLIFDEEDKYSPFIEGQNDIPSIEYDAERKCFVVTMEESYDPFFTFSFPKLVLEEEMDELYADDYKVISLGVRFNSQLGTKGQFFYQTSDFPGYSEPQSFHINYAKTNDYQNVYIDLRDAENWSGTIGGLRLDPLASCLEHCEYEIYYVGFFKTAAGAVEFGENWENAMKNGTELAPVATASPKPTTAPTQVPATAEPTAAPTEAPTESADKTSEPQPATDAPDNGGKDNSGDNTSGKKGLGTGAIIGIVCGAVVLAAAIAAGVIVAKKKKK